MRGVLLATLLLAAAHGAPPAWGVPCSAGVLGEGIVAESDGGRLRVVSVLPQSAAERAGFRPGDVIVQANGHRVRECRDLTRAVEQAQRAGVALLVLVSHGGREAAIVVRARAAPAQRAAEHYEGGKKARGSKRRAERQPVHGPPTVRAVLAGSRALAPGGSERVEVRRLVRELGALLAPDRGPLLRLSVHRARLREARQVLDRLQETGAGRGGASSWVAAFAVVFRYLEAGDQVWARAEQRRPQGQRSRPYPYLRDVAFFTDSAIGRMLDEFPFLRQCVRRQPAPGLLGAERSGRLDAGCARDLLWGHGRAELEEISARVLQVGSVRQHQGAGED